MVESFGTGLQLTNGTFFFVGDHVQLNDNGQNFLEIDDAENNRFIDSAFTLTTPGTSGTAVNSVEISGNADWSFVGCSFDDTQLAISNNASVKLFGGHFENPAGNSYDFFVSSGLTLEFYGVYFQQDSTSFPNGRFGTASLGSLTIVGGQAYSSVNIPTFVVLSGSVTASNVGLYQDSLFSSGWYTGSTTRGVTAFPADASGDAVVSGTMQANYVHSSGNLIAAGYVGWGGGAIISSSSQVPQVNSPTVGKAACIKSTAPVVLGTCSTQPTSTGSCTCN